MSKDKRKSVFNIAVIGLSGTEQIKGTSGVGKSCLCNRFVREEADAYYPDHTSVLSQSDFGGRVVNNDHFLYWGEVVKQDDNGVDYKFNIIEQTEFIDDQTYQPHRSSSNQVYFKRSAQTKITSDEKLMYICTDQLGVESEFESKLMPDGKLTIDGFLLCFDVSHATNRIVDDQVRFLQSCYHYLAKTKKPVLVALTKCDEAVPAYIDEAVKFATIAGGKRSSSLQFVETSASENINVTLAFLILAQIIDKTRSKSKVVSFEDAAQVRKSLLKDAKEQLEELLTKMVDDYHASWPNVRKSVEDKTAYLKFVDLEGKNAASKIFRKHVNYLRDEYRLTLQNEYLRYLPRALKIIVPNLSSVRGSWKETLQEMAKSSEYDNWIVSLDDVKSGNNNNNSVPWYENTHVSSLDDRRIPHELLLTADAERHFLFHCQDLETKRRRCEMKHNFKEMLIQSPQVTPGRKWGDVVKFFKHDSISVLTEAELSTIYEQYQAEIVEKAKKDFQELLYEKSEIFVTSNNASHMGDIHDVLKSDPRYVAMAQMQKEKDDILTRHISEALYPPTDNWGAKCLEEVLKSRRARLSRELPDNNLSSPSLRWQLKPDSDTLNVVLLGANGLSQELANEITVHSSDEYTLVDGCTHRLRLRSIDGDVSLPGNSFETSSFSPHGCIAVYSSLESLNYIERSLEITVIPCGEDSDDPPPFQGLPVSILLASYSNSQKEVHKLRDAGERLASRVGCPFIDVLAPEYAYNRHFHESQIKLAIKSLIKGIKERAGNNRSSASDINQKTEGGDGENAPDLRIVLCSRKDDLKAAEVALMPLLNHTSFRDHGPPDAEGEETEDTITVETYLGAQRRRIAITLTSYQCAKNFLHRENPVHGFILVYDTILKSSFYIMKAFASNTAHSYPMLLLCVSPNENQPSAAALFQQDPTAKQLVVDGNSLADRLNAKFMSASARHSRQPAVYSTFFKDAWEHKEEMEDLYRKNRTITEENSSSSELSEPQPPVPAPRSSASKLVERKSNSTEQLTAKGLYEVSNNPITPPSTLRGKMSSQTSCSGSLGTPDQIPVLSTPGSTCSAISDDYLPEVSNTSLTASLLDNEICEYPADKSKPSIQPNNSSTGATNQPGKLNQDLLNKVGAILSKAPMYLPDISQRNPSDPPYMQLQSSKPQDPTRYGAKRVLPPTSEMPEKPSTATANGLKVPLERKIPSPFSRNSAAVREGSSSGLSRRPTPHKVGKRAPLKSVDIDYNPSPVQSSPSPRTRHSVADLISQSFGSKMESESPSLQKKAMASSREDLVNLSLSPSLPGIALTAIDGSKVSKDKDKVANKKAKDEDKRKEKKVKEKDQRFRSKEKSKHNTRNLLSLGTLGNKHNVSDYFNKPLDDIMQNLRHMVPLFPEKCAQYIEKYGLHTEGLYRIPANAKERQVIIKKFDEDNNYDLKLSEVSVHTVAGCLTWFFSDKNLPESVIPPNLHDDFEDAYGMPDSSLRNLALRGVVRKLPYSNYATFKFVCTHLKNVSEYASDNKMHADNLAICWWNTLFRPDFDPISNGSAMKTCYKDVLTACIVQCGFMFYDQHEV